MIYFKFYTNKFLSKLLVGERFAAKTYGLFILIKDEYKSDSGLLEHEKTHVKQFWKNPLFFGLRYLLSKDFRLKTEVEAYKVQMKYSKPGSELIFAKYIINKYNLGLTYEDTDRIVEMLKL
jgi:hypothetical protein